MKTCICPCGGQRSGMGAIPHELFFETGCPTVTWNFLIRILVGQRAPKDLPVSAFLALEYGHITAL